MLLRLHRRSNDMTVVKSKEIVFRVPVFFREKKQKKNRKKKKTKKKKHRTFFQIHKYQDIKIEIFIPH